jgi:regulator of RNase E activity RraA
VPVEIGGITVQPGEVIHAGAEGVIKIPVGAIDKLLERAPLYRAFEHEAHQMLRRTDLSVAEKRQRLRGLLDKYGFKDCVSR